MHLGIKGGKREKAESYKSNCQKDQDRQMLLRPSQSS